MRRSTLLAALVLAALGGYIFWFERGPTEDETGERLFEIEESSILRIELRRRDEEPVVLAKEGEAWRLVSPVAAEADGTEVGLLLQNLATIRFEREVVKASEVDVTEFGLDPPSIEVTFRTADGIERSLRFGRDTPTADNQYARRDDEDAILVLGSHLSLNFERDSWDLRDKSIFDVEKRSDPKRIEVARPGGRLALESEAGLWFVTEPYRARADRFEATSLASRLRAAEMREIVSEQPENLEALGLVGPARVVRIALEDGETLVLEIGAKKEIDYYARTPSRAPIFLLDGALVDALDQPAAELASKKLFDFSAFDVVRFRIEEKGAARSFEKWESEGEIGWRELSSEAGRELDRTEVEDLLYELNGASAEGIVETPLREELGLGEPAFVITVFSKEPAVEEKVSIGMRDGGGIFALREGDGVALEIASDAWRAIEEQMTFAPPGAEAPP